MSAGVWNVHPEQGPAQERIQPAFGWMRWLARVEGPAFHCVRRHRKTRKHQILRLRDHPARKRNGPEILCGRSAQDDSMKVLFLPDPTNLFSMNTLRTSCFLSILCRQSIQSTDFRHAQFFSRTL